MFDFLPVQSFSRILETPVSVARVMGCGLFEGVGESI